jgi:hypothetical protein
MLVSVQRPGGFQPLPERDLGMSVYDVKGAVRKIEQRTASISGLERLADLDTFDVEFSRTGEPVKITNYKRSGKIHNSEHFLFDGTGVCRRMISFNGDGLQTGSTNFLYDTIWRCVGWIAHDINDRVVRRGRDQFDGQLLVATESYTAADVPVFRKSFDYNGNLLVRSQSNFYGLNGALSEQWISDYDSKGRIEKTFGLKPDGQPLGDGRYEYEYDEDNRKTCVWSFNDFDKRDVPNAVQLFQYVSDEAGNWLERRSHHRLKSSSEWRTRVSVRRIAYWSE